MVTNREAAPGKRRALHDLEVHATSLLHRRASRNLNVIEAEEPHTLGQRMADRFAKGAGSWRFILGFLGFLLVWMALNTMAALHHWDPYPYILLNLVLSCVAAIQAPVIVMSQNRQEARDRLRAEADYEVNLKAEVLLEHLTQELEIVKAMLGSAADRPALDTASGPAIQDPRAGDDG